jgi:hypothetical protein
MHIQNASGSDQTVTVKAFPQGSSTPSDSPTYNIPANASITVDFMSNDFANFGSGLGAFGYVIIQGTGNVAAVTNIFNEDTSARVQLYYSGFKASDAGQQVLIPGLFSGHSEWNSGVQVINVTGQTGNVTLEYTIAPLYGGGVQNRTLPIGANGSANFTMNQLGFPSAFGSAKVTSDNANLKIVALITSFTYAGSPVGFEFPALNPALATTRVAVPLAFNTNGLTDWNTGIGVLSIGAGGTITTTWVTANSNPVVSATRTQSSSANTLVSFDASTLSLPSNFVGSVFVESSGQPIMAVVNNTRYGQGFAAQYAGINYTP